MSAGARGAARGLETHAYVVSGVSCVVSARPSILERIDETYGAYRSAAASPDPYVLRVSDEAGQLVASDSDGVVRSCADEMDAVFAALEGVVRHVTGRLAGDGVYAIHAASLSRHGKGLVICGRSGSGKSTLAMALLGCGFGLLSDEFALSAPDERTILPYHRGVHIRPGTVELVPWLAFLRDRPHQPVSGGFRWTVGPAELEAIFPSCLSEAVPLGYIVFLEPAADRTQSGFEQVSQGAAAVELLRATTSADADFDGVLARMASLVAGVPCLRLHAGPLESSVDLLVDLVDASDV